MTTALDYARAYVARGWSVIPLVPGTKRPVVPVAPFLSGETRLTEDGLAHWWGAGTSHGIGIVCGQPSGGLVVVDVDPRNGGDLEAVSRDIPSAPCVLTGGGGAHFYCESDFYPPKGKTSRPGVDRQGDGGYVVAPPTVHPSGTPYRWAGRWMERPLPPPPDWVFERPAPEPGGTGDGGPWVATTLAEPDACLPGHQEETLTRLAWWAAGHLDRDIAEAVLWRWASCLTLGNPYEPWTFEHVRQKLDAAFAKREPEFVVQGVSSEPAPAADVDAIEACIVRASEYEVAKRDDWVVEHVAAPGCFTEVVGEVKKGKTTFNGHLVRCVLAGEPFLGWRVQRTPVVWYTEQVGVSLDATLERAGVRRHPDLHLLDQSRTFGKPWSAIVAALLRRCERVGARLLFVDTLTRLAGVAGEDENKAGVVAVLNAFQPAKALGVACVFVRHAGKSRENREDVSRAGRGSTAITGEMDVAVNLYQPGSEDVRRVKIVSRLGEEIAVLLKYDGHGYVVTDEDETPVSAPARRAADMRAKVETEFRTGNTTARGVASALGVDPKTARKYLREIAGGMADDDEE